MKLNELLQQITPLPYTVAEVPLSPTTRTIFSLSDSEIAPAIAGGDTPEQRDATASYLTHAANVLPELVEALRAVQDDLDLLSNLPGGSSELQFMVENALTKAENIN